MEGLFRENGTTSGSQRERSGISSSNTRKGEDMEGGAVIDNERPSTSVAESLRDHQGEGEETVKPRLWEDAYTSLVVVCLFSVSGFLLICLPFLPKAYPNHANAGDDNTLFVTRKVTIVTVSVFALIAMIYLWHNKDKLHDSGLALWPHKCKHCSHVLKLDLHSNALSTKDFHSLHENKEASTGEREHPINKSSLYVTYIFSIIVIGFVIFNLFALLMCSIIDGSLHVLQHQETNDIISIILYDLFLIGAMYFLNFRFIPAFFDAHLVGIPKLRWSVVLITSVSVWIAFARLSIPFALLTSAEDPYGYKFSSNCTLVDIMDGTFGISEPFFVELSIMNACVMIGLWSRFLPRYMLGLSKRFVRICPKDHQNSQPSTGSMFIRCLSSRKQRLKDMKEKQYLLGAKRESGHEGICLEDMAAVEESSEHSKDDSSHTISHTEPESMKEHNSVCRKSDHVAPSGESFSNSITRSNRSKRPLSRRLEISGAMMLVVGGLYFGFSNILMVEYSSDSSDDPGKGRYVQWLARMAFFIPEIVLIITQRRMTRRTDGSFSAKRETSSPGGHDNDNGFLVLMTGASLYEVTCLVASLGNLVNSELLSTDTITLNVVSAFASIFGTFRKSTESVFLLCVHRQHLRNNSEREWTLLCLLYMGMANATQWLWDSLIHEMTSHVAWPVLVTFFDGQVGEFAGTFLVPFDHLYELHVAIVSYEVFNMIRSL